MMRRRVVVAGALLACVPLAPRVAVARDGDGAHGRFDGDVTLVTGISAGTLAAPARTFLSADVRARYLDAAGVVFAYEEADAIRKTETTGEVRRGVTAALEFRPLFPIRFLKDKESGRRFADLVVDSIGVEAGAHWSAVYGSSSQRPGLLLGVGFEVPFASATGPWLRVAGSVRWTARTLEGDDTVGGRVVALTLGLAWHQLIKTPVIDTGDARVE